MTPVPKITVILVHGISCEASSNFMQLTDSQRLSAIEIKRVQRELIQLRELCLGITLAELTKAGHLIGKQITAGFLRLCNYAGKILGNCLMHRHGNRPCLANFPSYNI